MPAYVTITSKSSRGLLQIIWSVVTGLASMVVVTAQIDQVPAFHLEEPPPGQTVWPFDRIYLKNGAEFQGLLVSEEPDGYVFRVVMRRPGRPTSTLTTFFTKAEVQRLQRLNETERTLLRERLAELDPAGHSEQQCMEAIELVTEDWPGLPGGARKYESEHFILISSGSEELTRRTAVRLEQLYAAFVRFFPPQLNEASATRIWLAVSQEQYRLLLREWHLPPLLNPALYDPRRNQILVSSPWQELGQQLQSARLHHSQQLATLARLEAELRRLYRRPELERHLSVLERERKRIYQAERANAQQFEAATARIFPLLYHEAFHAYVGTFVYPPLPVEQVRAGRGTGELPRWLNEGLAQIFESAVIEAGELRADAPQVERLHRAQDWLRGKQGGPLLPVRQLLTAGPQLFATAHTDQKAQADRAYLTSWAMAYYLTFVRRLVTTTEFRQYLVRLNSGEDPCQAFSAWVGQSLEEFERQFHSDLLRLQRNGRLAPRPETPPLDRSEQKSL
ncbi:MAG: DUF1570 domain-containing protein [Gemmataceae bacterium]|nr:DUF1570 domain-containing protein [Gemmataceae bacterium]MCS7270459.1 DUF1570 domain-containing protein [Gemmataceae bacterium]MDW8243978.1 DUF1570 domain-containing protein [Thermogemmata sp.]